MRKTFRCAVAVAFALAAGCSDQPKTAAPGERLGPHQGTLVKLPGEAGYAEVLNAEQARGRASGRQGAPAQLVVYFLDPELKAPSSASASGVVVKLSIATGQPPVNVALEPAAGAADPLGAKRFASKPGAYHLGGVHGELAATVDGQPFSAEFDGVR